MYDRRTVLAQLFKNHSIKPSLQASVTQPAFDKFYVRQFSANRVYKKLNDVSQPLNKTIDSVVRHTQLVKKKSKGIAHLQLDQNKLKEDKRCSFKVNMTKNGWVVNIHEPSKRLHNNNCKVKPKSCIYLSSKRQITSFGELRLKTMNSFCQVERPLKPHRDATKTSLTIEKTLGSANTPRRGGEPQLQKPLNNQQLVRQVGKLLSKYNMSEGQRKRFAISKKYLSDQD